MVVGIVVGIGIFRLPTIVAQHSASELHFILFWLAGGLISILGALCYSELASNHPDAGGEYYFLSEAFGPCVGFLFNWGRMTVIQTGSIALAAFILGEYATEILPLGAHSSSIYAASTVITLTGVNIIGTTSSKIVQGTVTGLTVFVLIVTGALGLYLGGSATTADPTTGTSSAGAAMIFILLTYGGWNEGVYLSAELKNVRHNMARVLITSLLLVTTTYVLINAAYLHILGLESLRSSTTIGVDLTDQIFGTASSELMAFFVVVAALSTVNASIITGARTNYALGRDFEIFHYLGNWDSNRNTPRNALLFQGAIALGLVGLGSITKAAVSTMVDYTAPVFWFFILLTTASIFVFRRRDNGTLDYEVPFFPMTPLLFMGVCGYLLYSSLVFTGLGALVGIGIFLLGLPLYAYA